MISIKALRDYCLIIICISLYSCSRTPPEEAILANIDSIQIAVEEKKTRKIVSYLTDNFSGSHDLDKQGLRRLLMGLFLRHENINIFVTRMDITYDPRQPQIANMDGIVLLTGASNLLPENGKILKVKGKWHNQDGDWLLANAEWE